MVSTKIRPTKVQETPSEADLDAARKALRPSARLLDVLQGDAQAIAEARRELEAMPAELTPAAPRGQE